MKPESLAVIVSAADAPIGRQIRRLGDVFEEAQVPRQEVRADGVRITYVTQKRIRRGLVHHVEMRDAGVSSTLRESHFKGGMGTLGEVIEG